MNGDGVPDVVVVADEGPTSHIYILRGLADGTYDGTVALWSQQVLASAGRALLGDLNGDGLTDLIYVRSGGFCDVFLRKGSDFVPGVTFQVDALGCSAIADFDGDAKLDLLCSVGPVGFPTGMRIMLGNGDGTFSPGVDSATKPSEGAWSAIVRGKGAKSEMVLFGGSSSHSELHRLSAKTAAPELISLSVGGPSGLAADILSEGGSQLAFGNGGLSIYRLDPQNLSAPTSVATLSVTPSLDDQNTPASADMNGDGKADIVVSGPGGMTVYQHLVDDSFQKAFSVGALDVNSNTKALVDVNGDGLPDIIVFAQLTVYLNTSK